MMFKNISYFQGIQNQPSLSLDKILKDPSYLLFLLFMVWAVLFITPDIGYTVTVRELQAFFQQFKAKTFSGVFCLNVALVVLVVAMGSSKRKLLTFGIAAFLTLFTDPCVAHIDGDMRDAVQNLQREIFGNGWVTVGKIAAAAVGVVMAIARSSALPFAMGAAVAGGIHFFQKHTETAAACLF